MTAALVRSKSKWRVETQTVSHISIAVPGPREKMASFVPASFRRDEMAPPTATTIKDAVITVPVLMLDGRCFNLPAHSELGMGVDR